MGETANEQPLRGATRLQYRDASAANFPRKWDEYRRIADLRPTDHVLDAGCAEGWYTLELAKFVAHAHGFDKSETRIVEARRLAAERGIDNATFEVASVIGYPAEPLSYDVTLFAGVWGAEGVVGPAELELLLRATRRQLIARIRIVPKPDQMEQALEIAERVPQIHDACDRNDFDVLMFASNCVVAIRRGVEVRIPELLPAAIVPTKELADHPVVQSAAAIWESEPLPESPASA